MTKKKLEGIGGWLLTYVVFGLAVALYYIGIGLWLIILTIKLMLLEFKMGYFHFFSFGGGIFFSILSINLGVYGLFSLFLIIKRDKDSINNAQTFLWVNLIMYIVPFFFATLHFDVETLFFILIDGIFLAWILYFKRSIRVKNTLVGLHYSKKESGKWDEWEDY